MKKLTTGLKYAVLIVAAFVSIFPFFWMVLSMTNETVDIITGKMMVGKEFMTNLTNLMTNDLGFQRAVVNSSVIAIITTFFSLLLSSMAGYGFEIYRSPKKEWLFNLLLLSMMVPFSAMMIPLYTMFSKMSPSMFGINTLFSVIIPSVCTAFTIFLFRQNIKSFPKSLVEAARIDGLGELAIFFKIYMPTAKNIYAAAAIITFMSSWNNYLWPLVALQSPEKRTVPLVLSAMGSSYTPDYGMMMTGIVIATLPIAVIFFMLQKQFVQGMLGSVK
ncbi:MAG: carbohydrate ABC transporter permease [Vagococcus sp.]